MGIAELAGGAALARSALLSGAQRRVAANGDLHVYHSICDWSELRLAL